MAASTRELISGERVFSLDEIEESSRRAATGLKGLGVGQGDSVVILMRNDVPFFEVSNAVTMLGAYSVPINWHLHPSEVLYILKDSNARVLVAHHDLLAGLAGLLPPGLKVLSVSVPAEIAAAYPAGEKESTEIPSIGFVEWVARQAPNNDPATPLAQTMIYTSGTTGNPKGVRRTAASEVPPAALAAMVKLRDQVYGLRAGTRALVTGPMYHLSPNAFALYAGKVSDLVVLMARFDAEEFLRLVEHHRIDTAFLVPTMFVRLLRLPEQIRSRYDVSSLRFISHAAAPCAPEIKKAMIAWFGPIITEFYGSTECGAVTVSNSADFISKPGTVGLPTPFTEIRIMDAQGDVLGPNLPGEVYSRNRYAQDFTYHNRPDLRASIERDGFITSGDIGYLDEDGYLFLCDRKRDMVISGGVNIYPAEIEAALLTLDGVKDCAVFGIPDAEFGEAVMAVVEPLPGATLSPPALLVALKDRIARYKIPRFIEIQYDLPREDSGKIFKRKLRDPFWEGTGRAI